MEYSKMSLFEIRDLVISKKASAEEITAYFIAECEKKKNLNAMIEIFDDALTSARIIDDKIKNGESVGKLAGVPVAIKDNILYKGHKAGCASALMQDFVSPYSATVVEKLLAEDAIILGRTNMDEFAMGGSCEKSFYGPCHNSIDFDYVSGGSSGGSAVAVASGMVPVSIGTDTGGSIRQPASYNGIVGIKPTYGLVSRYGIVAFASSLDQASPFAKTSEECEYVLDIIRGKDPHDITTVNADKSFPKKEKYKLGICTEVVEKLKNKKEFYNFKAALEKISDSFELVSVSIENITDSLACYYIIAPAEVASNLARFDGIKYTRRADNCDDLESVYVKSRTEGFGSEVKKRIMLGNFVLSSGYYDAYYGKAKKVQRLIRREVKDAFSKCDVLILPTTMSTAFRIGEKTKNPVEMYMEDLFTVPANIVGIPAISVPYDKAENNLPLGMQFMADEHHEAELFDIARIFTKAMEEKL